MSPNDIQPKNFWAPPAVCLITYPRSGSNYFAEYFKQLTGIYIAKSHDVDYARGRKIITIVRNPIDCIASRAAMFYETANVEEFVDLSKVLDKLDIEDYSKFYTRIISEADIFIDYESFIKSPKETMSNVLDKLDIPYEMINYTQTLSNKNGYMISSKETFLYDSIKNHYEQQDNQSLFDLYNKALSLCNI